MGIDWSQMKWKPWKATKWHSYDHCPRCGAWYSEPCFDRRKKLRPGLAATLYKQHPCEKRPRTTAWHESWL